jgi:hypothetical protein
MAADLVLSRPNLLADAILFRPLGHSLVIRRAVRMLRRYCSLTASGIAADRPAMVFGWLSG